MYSMQDVKGKNKRQISNFKPTIHYFLSSDTNPKRVFEIINDNGEHQIFNIDAAGLIKKDTLCKIVESRGNYIFYGNNTDVQELKTHLFKNEKKAFEIPYLGYNSKENFYVFCNKIIDAKGIVHSVNKDGLIMVNDKIFYFDTFKHFNEHSYKNMLQLEADETNAEMKFIYKKSNIAAMDYFNQFVKVFQNKGAVGIFFAIASFYRDIIFKETGAFPHLFLIGKPYSGKSTYRKGVLSFFGNEQNAIMLGTGSTQKAGLRRLAQFSNGLITFDEYKNDIDTKYIELFKGAFDGEGYERAAKTMDNKTISTSPRSALIIAGQEMPTKENALFSRGLLMQFYQTEFNADEKAEFINLEKMQRLGLSDFVTELMKHRDLIKKEFIPEFETCYNILRSAFNGGVKIERVLKNYASIVTPYYILKRHKILDINGITNVIEFVKGLIESQAKMLVDTNEINTFWDVVKLLIENKSMILTNDYTFHQVDGMSCICIRINNVYPKYNTHCINQRLSKLDRLTLLSYLKNEKSYHKKDSGKDTIQISIGGQKISYLCFNTAFIDVKFNEVL